MKKKFQQKIYKCISAVNNYDFESLSFRIGIKPAIRIILDPIALPRIYGNYHKKGIFFECSDFKVVSTPWGLRRLPLIARAGQIIVYVSKKKDAVRELKHLEDKLISDQMESCCKSFLDFTSRIGKLLGYPQCCIDFFLEYNALSSREIKIRSLFNTKHSFEVYLNNLYEHSCIKLHSLISHLPCSYDCKYSVSFARQIFETIKKVNPGDAALIEYFLRLPFIYFLNGRIAVFESPDYGKKLSRTDISHCLNSCVVFPQTQRNSTLEDLKNKIRILNSQVFIESANHGGICFNSREGIFFQFGN